WQDLSRFSCPFHADRNRLDQIFGDPIERVRFARSLPWREPDSNHRFRVTRLRFQNRLKSPLPDSAPTEVRREREPTPRGRLAPSAGPMVRIPVPSSSESGANSRSVEETRGPEMGELSPLSSIYDLVSHHP